MCLGHPQVAYGSNCHVWPARYFEKCNESSTLKNQGLHVENLDLHFFLQNLEEMPILGPDSHMVAFGWSWVAAASFGRGMSISIHHKPHYCRLGNWPWGLVGLPFIRMFSQSRKSSWYSYLYEKRGSESRLGGPCISYTRRPSSMYTTCLGPAA